MQNLNLTRLIEDIRQFAKARNWEQYHTPKNISMALSVEASELAEIFQWLTSEESYNVKKDATQIQKVKDEVADILVYLLRMVDLLDIDVNEAIKNKMKKNAEKYPVDKAHGNAKKYDEY